MKLTTTGNLLIKKHTFPQWITLYIFFMPFFLGTLQGFLGLPSLVKYTIDAAWLAIALIIFFGRSLSFNKKLVPYLVFLAVFFLITFVVYLFNYESFLYYFWGLRNNFRFYFAFFAFCIFFDKEDAAGCLKFIDVVFWINIGVCLFQFFVQGYEQDYLGGIFGVEKGCNSYTITFFSIVIAKSLLMFMNKQEKFGLCAAKCGVVLLISAMAELKAFFLLFVLILLLATMFTAYSWRKFALILAAVIIFSVASTFITSIFGAGSEITFDRMLELITAENYASEEDLGRFTAIPIISATFLTSWPLKLFGMGLGNCDTSSFDAFNTAFYQRYSELHYNWFSSAFLFLETGYVGVIVFASFFVMCFIFASVMKKRQESNLLYCQMAMIISIVSIVLMFYNPSLRIEIAYLIYFVFALPFIGAKKDGQLYG